MTHQLFLFPAHDGTGENMKTVEGLPLCRLRPLRHEPKRNSSQYVNRTAGSIEDILAALVPQENGCLVWPHGTQHGYGCVMFEGSQRVHRLAWVFLNGPIPTGHDIHHTCGNKLCANVEHLECLKHGEHSMHHNTKNLCCRGHRMEGENLMPIKKGHRCRACYDLHAARRCEARKRERRERRGATSCFSSLANPI